MFKHKPNTTKIRWITVAYRGILAGLGILLVCSITFGAKQAVLAAPSDSLNFQARLYNSSGNTVADGTYNIEFKIYDSLGAGSSAQGTCVGGVTDDCVWVETRTGANQVTVKNGYFSVALGDVTAFPSINWDQELYLTMNIGGTGSPSYDGEMTPRIKLTSVPYAFQANTARQLEVLDSGFTGNLSFDSLTADRNILLPNASGTLLLNSTGFAQNGNSFGATAVLGTNDTQSLAFETDGTTRLTIDTSGNATLTGDLTVQGTGTSSFAGNLTVGSGSAVQLGAGISGLNNTVGTVIIKPGQSDDTESGIIIKVPDSTTYGELGSNGYSEGQLIAFLNNSDSNVQDSTNYSYSISAVANTTPVRITTSASHSFQTGDVVRITNTGIGSIDSKWWKITVIDGTHFDLVASTAAGTSATGNVFGNRSSVLARFDATGGFGTTSGLHVATGLRGNAGQNALYTTGAAIWVDPASDVNGIIIDNASSSEWASSLTSSYFLARDTRGGTGNVLQIDSTGKLFANRNALVTTNSNSVSTFEVQNSSSAPVFSVDTANSRVGVGTSAPGYTLHAKTAATSTIATETTATSGNQYALFSSKTSSQEYRFGTGISTEALFGVNDKFFLYDATANAVRLTVGTSGNVGIGDTSPAYLLTVGNGDLFGVNSSGNLIFEGSTVDANQFTITVADPTADRTYTIPNSTASTDTFCLETLANCGGGTLDTTGTPATNQVAYFADADTLQGSSNFTFDGSTLAVGVDFTVDGNTTLGNASGDSLTINGTAVSVPNDLNFDSNTLFIDAANNRVGVGTASPSTIFEVNGNATNTNSAFYSGNAANWSAITLGRTSLDGQFGIAASAGNFSAQSSAGDFVVKGYTEDLILGATNASGNIVFTTGTAGSDTTKAILLNNGKFGIGDTTPAALFTVGNGDLFQVDSSGDITTAAAEALSITTGTTGILTLDSGTTGAINIGTGANAKTITIGNSTGATSLVLNAGTGAINIGTNAVAHTTTIGNGTGASSVVANCGTGACSFGSNAIAHTTNVGSSTGAATTNINAGTGGLKLGNNGVANTIQLGNTTGAVAQTINLGTNATASSTTTVNIGSTIGTSATTIQAGSSGITLVSATTVSSSLTVNGNTTLGDASGDTLTINGSTITLANGFTSCTALNTNSSGVIGCDTNTYLTSATAFLQNGNSFGSTAVLGTNDNFGLSLETNGTTALTIDTSQNATFVGNVSVTNNLSVGTTDTTYDMTFGGDVARTIGLQVNTANAAGNNLTITAGSAGAGASAYVGGDLLLQGGSAAGTGNANGGDVYLTGGDGVGTGTKGLVVIGTPTYETATTQICASDCTVTQANVDSSAVVIVDVTATGHIVTLPDPTNSVAGRMVYVTAANGSADFTLRANGGGTGNDIAMRQNTTASMIWNGSDWTAAGASSSTTLQAAYDNTLTAAGGAEIILNNTASSNGLTVRNNSSNPIIGEIFEAQTAIGSNLFSVNNNAVEYATNGGAETYGASATTFPASTWGAAPDGATVTRHNTIDEYIATGQGSVSVVTSATVNQGASNTLSTALTANLRYTVSFAVRGTSSFSTLDVLYSPDGTNTGTVACTSSQTVTQGTWTRVLCNFDAPASGVTSSNAVFIRQSDATARTFYIENLSVNVKADVNHAVDGSVDDAGNFSTYWTAAPGGGTVSRELSTIYDTSASVKVTTSATVGQGITNNMSIAPTTNTQYLVTFYAKSSNTFSDVRVRYSRDGGTSTVPCVDYNTRSVSASTWTRVTCLFTTDSTTATNADLIIDQETAVARDFYVDALSITLNTNTASNVKIGGGSLGGPTTLLTLDRSAGPPVAANNDSYLGSMYYDTETGRIQCYESGGWGTCGAPPDNIVNLNPEYAGSVLNGTGVGTMTADVCANESGVLQVNSSLCSSGEARNYYRWTSPQATEQTYSIYVTYQLPSTFDGFANDETVQLTGRVDSTTNAAVTFEMFRSEGGSLTRCGSGETTVATTANTWQTVGINGNESTGCGFTSASANGFVLFKLNLKAKSNANAYVSTLTFTTTGR